MENTFDWDAFLETVKGETVDIAPQIQAAYINQEFHDLLIAPPATNCFVCIVEDPMTIDSAIELWEASSYRVVPILGMDHLARITAVFPESDDVETILVLKGCTFVDLTS